MWYYLNFYGITRAPYVYYPHNPTTTIATFMMYPQSREHLTTGSRSVTGNFEEEMFFYSSNQLATPSTEENEAGININELTISVNEENSAHQNEVVQSVRTSCARVLGQNDHKDVLVNDGNQKEKLAQSSENISKNVTTNQLSKVDDLTCNFEIDKITVNMDDSTWKNYLKSFQFYSKKKLKKIHRYDGEEIWSCTCGKVPSKAPVRKNQECLVHFDIFKEDMVENTTNIEVVTRTIKDTKWLTKDSVFLFYRY